MAQEQLMHGDNEWGLGNLPGMANMDEDDSADGSADLPDQNTPRRTFAGKQPRHGIGKGLKRPRGCGSPDHSPGNGSSACLEVSAQPMPNLVRGLQAKNRKLQDLYEDLQDEHGDLQDLYDDLQDEHGNLQDAHDDLKLENDDLKRENKKLTHTAEKLENKNKVLKEFKHAYKKLRKTVDERKDTTGQPQGETEAVGDLMDDAQRVIKDDPRFGFADLSGTDVSDDLQGVINAFTKNKQLDLTTQSNTEDFSDKVMKVLNNWMAISQFDVSPDGDAFVVDIPVNDIYIIYGMENQTPQFDTALLPKGSSTNFLKFVYSLVKTVHKDEKHKYHLRFTMKPRINRGTQKPTHCTRKEIVRKTSDTPRVAFFFKFQTTGPWSKTGQIAFGHGTQFETMGKAVFQKWLFTKFLQVAIKGDRFKAFDTFL